MIDKMDATILSQEEREELLESLEPVANAVKRIDYFNQDSVYPCSDNAYVEAGDPVNGGFELFADPGEFAGEDPAELLTVAHLRRIMVLYDRMKG